MLREKYSEQVNLAVQRAKEMVKSGLIAGVDQKTFLDNVGSVASQIFDKQRPAEGTFNVAGVAESIRLRKKELWHDDETALAEITGIASIWMGAFPENNPKNLDSIMPVLPNVIRAVFGLKN